MNPTDGWGSYCLMKHFCQHQILEKKLFNPHMTKGLEESVAGPVRQSFLERSLKV